eukprot:gene8417-8601_t
MTLLLLMCAATIRDNDDETRAMLDNLRTSRYSALILDTPVVQYFAAQATQCDLFPVGESFETFDLSIAFPENVPDALPQSVSASIVRLQTTRALLDVLENQFIKGTHAGAGCPQRVASHTSAAGGIHLQQVLGLWYILLFTLGIAAAVVVGQRLVRWRETAQAVRDVRSYCKQAITLRLTASATGSAARNTRDAERPAGIDNTVGDCVAVLGFQDGQDEIKHASAASPAQAEHAAEGEPRSAAVLQAHHSRRGARDQALQEGLQPLELPGSMDGAAGESEGRSS